MSNLTIFEGNGQELTADEITETMEKFAKVFSKVRDLALKGTRASDWCDQQGKPYLMISGAEKIKNMFGISVVDVGWEKTNITDDKGHYYVITYKGTFSWKMSAIEMTGNCSSRDKFFSKAEQADVVFTNIQKKAYTNMMGRGLKALLGLNNLSWDELSGLGLNKGGSAEVKYRTTEEKSEGMEAKQAELRSLILGKVENKPDKARILLKQITAYNRPDGSQFEGHSDMKKMTEKQLDFAISKAKKL